MAFAILNTKKLLLYWTWEPRTSDESQIEEAGACTNSLCGCSTKTIFIMRLRDLRDNGSVAAGGYNFEFLVTCITGSKMDITLRKRSKIITPNEHTSVTVIDIASVVGVGKSSVSRILRTFQNSRHRLKKKKKM
ncbi:hypothetical protein TNCV_950281 [Trichonephila clavipes]|nr:hypothetical protein TNCV_950281 [Trichonephila clavipes]